MEESVLMNLIRQAIITYQHPLKVYALGGSRDYGLEVAKHLDIDLADHEEHLFEDDECYLQSVDGPTGNVRGHDVFVIQSLYSDEQESVSDKFMKLAIFLGSLRSADAHRITAVIPHLAWARQDRKTKSRAPVTTKIIACMLEAVGIDHAVFLDVHNLSAEQNAFSLRCPTDNLEAKIPHARWCAERLLDKRKIVCLAPDAGGFSRTDRFATALQKILASRGWTGKITLAAFDKLRVDGNVRGQNIIGDVTDADVVIVDDMISTASTVAKASKAILRFGGRVHAICATHGLFVGKANEYLDGLDTNIVVADTVVPWRLSPENRQKVHVVSTAKMVADAICKIHSGTGSISELLKIH